MIQFENLSIKGFCSIDSMDINLNKKGITLIKGPNGTGKSTWLSAIVWVLYGKNLKGVTDVSTWSKYKPKDYQGTKVEIFWRKGNNIYQVIRCQNFKGEVYKAKGANRLIFTCNAEVIDDKKKVNIQSEIVKTLGMSYNLFMSSLMFGQGMKRLVQESGTDQKKIFEEIFNLEYITKAQSKAKDIYNKISSNLTAAETSLRYMKNELSNNKENLKANQQEAKLFNQILKLKLDKLKELKKETLQKLKDWPEVEKPNTKKLTKLKSEYHEIKAHISKLEHKVNNLSLEDVLENVIQLLKAKKYNKALEDMMFIQQTFSKLDISKSQLNTLLDNIRSEENLIYKGEQAYSRHLTHKQKLEEVKHSIKKEKSSVYKPKINDTLELNINKLESDINIQESLINGLKNNAEDHKWLYQEPLGPNGLKAYIFDNSVDELNQILKNYSDILGIYVKFVIDTSTTRKDFQTLIQMDGSIVLFEELSGGQKQLIHLAMALAMNELITKEHDINIAFMDELFESLSFDNIEIVVNLIKKVYKDRNLFLVTHHDSLPIGNARNITVNRNKGISEYIF